MHTSTLLFIFLLFSCSDIKDKNDEIYLTVDQVILSMEGDDWIKDGKPQHAYILGEPYGVCSFTDTNLKLIYKVAKKQGFDEKDMEFVKMQISDYANFKYDRNQIMNKTIIPTESIESILESRESFWQRYEELYGNIGFYNISFPLYSVNREKAIVIVEATEFQSGTMGGIYIFEKSNGRFKLSSKVYSFL